MAESTDEDILRDMVECKNAIIVKLRAEIDGKAEFFSPKQVSQAVKAAFLIGQERRNGWLGFSPAALAEIAALAGLSESQGKALYHELV